MKLSQNPFSQNQRIPLQSIYALAVSERLSPQAFRRAMLLSGHAPGVNQAWQIADRLALGLGIALMLLGVIFGVAYNWEYLSALLGAQGKFIALQVMIAGTCVFAVNKGLDGALGKAALIAAIVLIGPLLAVFGQTYQTGADTFSLFLTWAGLAVFWVLASRNAGTWLLWIIILETALMAYIFSRGQWLGPLFGAVPGYQSVALANALILLGWEVAATRYDWMRGGASFSATQTPRLIAWVLVGVATTGICAWIITSTHLNGLGVVLWLVTMVFGYLFYRPKREIFMLTAGLVSLLVVVLTAVGRLFIFFDSRATGLAVFLLIMGIFVYFYISWARGWMHQVVTTPQSRTRENKS